MDGAAVRVRRAGVEHRWGWKAWRWSAVPGALMTIAVVTIAILAPAAGHTARAHGAATASWPRFGESAAPDGWSHAVLTPDGGDRYVFSPGTHGMTIAAPRSNRDANLRMVYWRTGSAEGVDQQSCAQWDDLPGDLDQPGAALRIVDPGGRLRAITVTRNVWMGGQWIFNFHTWDTARTEPFVSFGQVALEGLLGPRGLVPLPWEFCARARGDLVEFKVWPLTEHEPAWGDPGRSGRATLPPGWEAPGVAGWYVAHLQAPDVARFTHLRPSALAAIGGDSTEPVEAAVGYPARRRRAPRALTVPGPKRASSSRRSFRSATTAVISTTLSTWLIWTDKTPQCLSSPIGPAGRGAWGRRTRPVPSGLR
jgi:hypothetical protein